MMKLNLNGFNIIKNGMMDDRCIMFFFFVGDLDVTHALNIFSPLALQASWLKDIPEADLKNYAEPTGKIQTKIFHMKYNASVAVATFDQK